MQAPNEHEKLFLGVGDGLGAGAVDFRIDTEQIIRDLNDLSARDSNGPNIAMQAYFEDMDELSKLGSIDELFENDVDGEPDPATHPLSEYVFGPRQSAAPTPQPSCESALPLILARAHLHYVVIMIYEIADDRLTVLRFIEPSMMDAVAWSYAR